MQTYKQVQKLIGSKTLTIVCYRLQSFKNFYIIYYQGTILKIHLSKKIKIQYIVPLYKAKHLKNKFQLPMK